MRTMRWRQNVAASCQLAVRQAHRFGVWTGLRTWFGCQAFDRQQAGSLLLRAGTTLTEVLMSLMIMSIGVVMVATVFPIATLRTLEANKQTNSTIASFNADAAITARPELIHNPDDGKSESDSLSPLSLEPAASKYTARGYQTFGTEFRGHNYVVDPLGFWELFTTPPPPPGVVIHQEFGNVAGSPPTALYPDARRVKRYPAWFTAPPLPLPTTYLIPSDARNAAANFVSQPDNWKSVTEAALDTTVAQTSTALTLDIEADLTAVSGITGIPATQSVLYRATIFDSDGLKSETRLLTVPTPVGQQVTLAAPLSTWMFLDVNGNGFQDTGDLFPSRVRVEVADQVYTWMLTVRKASTGKCGVDAVVFFKRGFDPAYEEVHTADFRVNGYGADDIPDNADDTLGPNYRVRVRGFTDRPATRRGGYVFDTSSAFWYRIRGIEKETATEMYLILDEPVRGNNGTAAVPTGGAILHPNVVNVFPLDNKEP